MSVFWKVLRETYSPEMADVSDLLKDRREGYHVDQHPELQTHNISMQLYVSKELVRLSSGLVENSKIQRRKKIRTLYKNFSRQNSSLRPYLFVIAKLEIWKRVNCNFMNL